MVELDFEGKPHENEKAWLLAKTENFDGSQLQFVLERTDENGNWYEIGSAVSTVKDNEARNSVSVPVVITRPGEPAPEGATPVKLGKNVFGQDEELIVWLDPRWLEGKGFQVTMERRVMDDGGSWQEVEE